MSENLILNSILKSTDSLSGQLSLIYGEMIPEKDESETHFIFRMGQLSTRIVEALDTVANIKNNLIDVGKARRVRGLRRDAQENGGD